MAKKKENQTMEEITSIVARRATEDVEAMLPKTVKGRKNRGNNTDERQRLEKAEAELGQELLMLTLDRAIKISFTGKLTRTSQGFVWLVSGWNYSSGDKIMQTKNIIDTVPDEIVIVYDEGFKNALIEALTKLLPYKK